MHAVRQVGQEAFAVIIAAAFMAETFGRVLAGIHGLSFTPWKARRPASQVKGLTLDADAGLRGSRGPNADARI